MPKSIEREGGIRRGTNSQMCRDGVLGLALILEQAPVNGRLQHYGDDQPHPDDALLQS